MNDPEAIVELNEKEAECGFICPSCGKETKLVVPISGLLARSEGAFIQTAFPTLNADDRELFVSGLCRDCFPKEFDEEEFEDEN
jgi:hypothetical protein